MTKLKVVGRVVSGTVPLDMTGLRAAIKRDALLVNEEAEKLIALAERMKAANAFNMTTIDEGTTLLDSRCLFASDLDMQASRLARRVDHQAALIELAIACESEL